MSNPENRDKIIGIVASVTFHVVIILILFFVKIYSPSTDDGSGILVAIGTNYEIVPEKPASYTPPKVTSSSEEITQNNEPSITSEEEKKRKEQERLEAERKAKEEAERKEAERKESERINSLISGAFSSSSDGSGAESKGSPNGNSQEGAESGNAGYGLYDLGGRGMVGRLPKPSYDNSNIEGKLVVNITVTPAGKVASASINAGKSDPNASASSYLREKALEAARKAVFEVSNSKNNQNGTITYFFKITR